MKINRFTKLLVGAIVAGGSILSATPAHAEDNTEKIISAETLTSAEEPAPSASFVSFCESVILLNEGNVTIEFTIGDSLKGGSIEVPAYESREAAIHFSVDGVPIRAYYNDDLFYEVSAKLTPPCIPIQWEAPTQTVVCGGEDVISVPEETHEVHYYGHGGPGLHIVSAVLTYDDRVLETWEFHESEEGCQLVPTTTPTMVPLATTLSPTVSVGVSPVRSTPQPTAHTLPRTGANETTVPTALLGCLFVALGFGSIRVSKRLVR